ncbi:MAG: cyclic nucleotide-binding domain-containing protein [Anaerolineae bacterium]|nr:cyclic nucleotide-binding domain-containing protein [Anaerolineae bacterium]
MAFVQKPILALDIVDFASMTEEDQTGAIRALVNMLNQAIPGDQNRPSSRIWIPAGGGGILVFWHDVQAALTTALALGRLVSAHNREPDVKPLRLRAGLHAGMVMREAGLDSYETVWGDAIDLASHMTAFAKPDQILASETFFRQARLYNPQPGRQVTWLGKWWVRQNEPVVIYNVFTTDGAGIPPAEVKEWYGPFNYPLTQAIKTYEAMLKAQTATGPAFRVAVLAKRLLDLDPQHKRAREVLKFISMRRSPRAAGASALYDVFFSELSLDALLHFLQNARFGAFQRGDIIAREGEKADALMMIVSGEVIPSLRGKRLRERDPEHSEGEREIIFREGHIIGEMGLFNPMGTRTASLEAFTNATTLTIDYDWLRAVPDGGTRENKNRLELQERIWSYYCARTIENQIYTHPLFQKLSSAHRSRLSDDAKFMPAEKGAQINLAVEDAWNNWMIVVAGEVAFYNQAGEPIAYGPGDCLGPVRLVVTGAPPFSKVEVAPNTHLVRFSWGVIRSMIDSSDAFCEASIEAGHKEMIRLGLIPEDV